MTSSLRPSWCEIDLKALAHNVRQVKGLISSDVQFYGVCKNDAYGCGAKDCAPVMQREGVTAFAVSDPEDAESIRAAGIDSPILLYASTTPDTAEAVADLNLIVTIHDFDGLEAFSRVGRPVDVHVELDCGYGRLGFTPDEWPVVFARLRAANNLRVVGLYTHFSEVEDRAAMARQADRFAEAAKLAENAGLHGIELMGASSRVMLGYPELNFSAVNPGRILYGMMEDPWLGHLDLRPVIGAVKSRVLQVKQIPNDFDLAQRAGGAGKSLRTAVISFGFKDGLPRQPAGGTVLVRGRRAPIVGMRATEHTVIDISDIPGVQAGDEVIIVGRQGGETIDGIEAVATYDMPMIELLPRMSRSLPRHYLS